MGPPRSISSDIEPSNNRRPAQEFFPSLKSLFLLALFPSTFNLASCRRAPQSMIGLIPVTRQPGFCSWLQSGLSSFRAKAADWVNKNIIMN